MVAGRRPGRLRAGAPRAPAPVLRRLGRPQPAPAELPRPRRPRAGLVGARPDRLRAAQPAPRAGPLDPGRPGQLPRRLTRDKADEESPAWSPDGRRLAFVRGRPGRAELVVMDADGRHERRLTRGVGAASPAWSPDGRRIAYSAGPRGRRPGVRPGRAGADRSASSRAGGPTRLAPAWQPTGGDPVIAAAGDIACDPANRDVRRRPRHPPQLPPAADLRRPARRSTSRRCSTLGDAQYPDGAYSDFLAGYGPSWGRLKGLTRPVPGNHEYGTPGAAGYFDYFDGAGRPPGVAGGRDRGYYSFDVGTWHVVALNSNCGFLPGGCAAGSPQEQWLRPDLAAHPAAVHARLLAPPALRLRGGGRDAGHAAALAGALRRGGGRRPQRPRPCLRALRPAERRRRGRPGAAGSASSSSGPAAATSRASARSGPTARSAAAAPTGCWP